MSTSRTISFDGWVLRADIGELAKNGRKIRLQQRPLLVLEELLAHPGELVTRERLIARLWPKGVVDFDTGLNTAVSKLRVALDDVGDDPRYIETIPRKGYRFIGKIETPPAGLERETGMPVVDGVPPPIATPAAAGAPAALAAPPPTRRLVPYAVSGVLVLALAVLVGIIVVRKEPESSVRVVRPKLAEDVSIVVLPLKSAPDDPDPTLAEIAGNLLRQRLGRFESAVVVDATSLAWAPGDPAQLRQRATARSRYTLDGSVTRTKERVHVGLQLLDTRSARPVVSFKDDRVVSDFAGAIEAAARAVAGKLHLREGAVADARAITPVDLEAYAIYLKAQKLLQTERIVDILSAVELNRRATVLDPKFARAYVGLSQSLQFAIYFGEMSDADESKSKAEARSAIDRALALEPALGAAFIERAGLAPDAATAEALFREGLKLAPNDSAGHQRFSEFLFEEYRRGEALEEMDRALILDPLNPRLYQRDALFRFLTNGDVVAHDRLLEEALAINPKMASAMYQLGTSKHVFSGNFAEGIRLLERAIALDPLADELKIRVATFYLDVEDPSASAAVLAQCAGAPRAWVEVAQYRGERRRAAQLAQRVSVNDWRTMWSVPEATALRDEAIVTGDFGVALDLLGKRFPIADPSRAENTGRPRDWNRALSLVYAHTLVAAGEIRRGRQIAEEVLAQLDSESIGRPQYFFSRDRAGVFAILGDKERALEELGHSFEIGHYHLWWYLAERDPLFEGMRSDPRFQALAARAKQHRVEQRALLDEMRRAGQVPARR